LSAARELVVRAQALLADRDLRRLPTRLGAPRGADAARLTAWIHGTLRHRRTLHALLGGAARRALKGCPPALLAGLELGAFRVVWSGEPAAAVADEIGPLHGRKGREHLTRVLLALEAALEGPAGPHPGDELTLPLDRARSVRLKKPLLGLAGRRLAARLGILFSLPDPLVEAWLAHLGPETAAEVCRAMNDPPPLFARANPLRTTPAALAAALAEEGVGARPLPAPPGALVLEDGRGRFRRTRPWAEGWFTIQDLTAQEAAPALAPAPGERVLDLCAAPGTKTTALAELGQDRLTILACDRSPARLRKVEENARRLGLTSITPRALDARRPDALQGEAPFAAILVDAPCSNTGVLRRRPEARWRYDPARQRLLARDQARILRTAVAALAPGGRLLWSVCAIEPEEGSGQVRALLAEAPDLRLEHERLTLPSPEGGDGGYQALMRKK
jgi:16S rRNA (cytosine967-C5)-methyltransferase